MKRVALTAEKREIGKGVSRRLRVSGKVPGVLYGRSIEPMAVSVNRHEMEKIVKGEAGMNVMIDLAIAGGDSGLALIRDYQADPFKRKFTHIDFQAIIMKDKIEVEVPVEFTGTAIGVKEGGVLDQMRRTLLIKTLPDRIPTSIKVDISGLNIGDSIHADDIQLPDGVEYPHKANYTIAAVVPPTKVEETVVVPAEGAVPAEGEVPAEGAEAAPAKEGAEAAPAKEVAPAKKKKE